MSGGEESAQAYAGPQRLSKTYGLKWDQRPSSDGHIDASGGQFLFVELPFDSGVPVPAELASITQNRQAYALIPRDVDLPDHFGRLASQRLACRPDAAAFVPLETEDWTAKADGARIVEKLDRYVLAVKTARNIREARELLTNERHPRSRLYASAAPVFETAPMLIEGLMRERGVSVFYGNLDEFKTTLVLDMAAHIAMGAPWQGRRVSGRPVIWYALEGGDEIPGRLRALEASIRGKDPEWGNDGAPVSVRERIPEGARAWRAEIAGISERWVSVFCAREILGEVPLETQVGSDGSTWPSERYPVEALPVIVIDTLSHALGGEDEKGPQAVRFIGQCLDLLKPRPDMAFPRGEEEFAKWREEYPDEPLVVHEPVASHIIVIHHPTKSGSEIAGHRAIAADTGGLYRVRRFGKLAGKERPYAGELIPERTKGIPRPSAIRFEVAVVPIEGTKQTAAILKDKAAAVPKELWPAIEALRELDECEEITPSDLNQCLDVVAAKEGKKGSAIRMARKRSLDKLTAAGVIAPVEDDNGNFAHYAFHDPGVGVM